MYPAFPGAPPINRLLLVAAALSMAAQAQAASFLDPALHFQKLTTAHFVIYFHQGEDRIAARLAGIAEEQWPKVGAALGVRAPRRTHVILADQSELANGWASPLPYDTIFITAAAPPGSDFIGRTDDWLRLVFTHEFTHIVHLDRSEGWARVFRGVFGRTSVAFPNLWLPTWQIEGLASYEESAITGEGRLHAGDFRAVELEAARTRRAEPLDRVNGGLTDWPGGFAPYAFGLGFHDYLSQRFGEDRFGQLASRTSRSLPYFGSRAFKKVYGESLGTLWRDYERSLSDKASRVKSSNLPNPMRLTHDGFSVFGPRFVAADCAGCPPAIIYTVRNPDGFPSLNVVGGSGGPSRRLADRYLGSTFGASNQLVVFDQQQLHRNVGLYSDLYLLDRRTGEVRALTDEQRLQDPDLSPDGQTIVCVRQIAGRGEIVTVRLKPDTTYTAFETIVEEDDTQFSAPRWSPDGRRIVVERHQLGALSEIIVVDAATHAARVVASDPSARIVTPTWRPDGRAIVAAADFNSDTFNLYEFTIGGSNAPHRLTDTPGGALWPDVSPNGEMIAFAGYTADGYDVFTTRYPLERPSQNQSPIAGTELHEADTKVPAENARSVHSTYSPWPTLTPTSWWPIIETGDQVRAGVATSAVDVLRYHAYAVAASWLVEAPSDAMTPPQGVPDWSISYAYDRWRPTFFAALSSETLFGAGPADDQGRPTPATLRSRDVEAGVLLPFRRVRSLRRVFASVIRTDDRYTLTDRIVSVPLTASRFGLAASTARFYGYSISPEDGYAVGATSELSRRGVGSSADETTLTGDARAYLPGLGRHQVAAIRIAGGTSTGTPGARRTFLIGGAGPALDVLDFGREAVSLLRGFPSQSFAGTHVALVNADYRFPLARPQRGAGTWPLFLHTIHGAVFADAGQAWTDRFRAGNTKTSLGGEFSLDVVAGYSFPFTASLGAAWGRDGTDRSNRATAYLRIGRAF